jgi:hypothetical protein
MFIPNMINLYKKKCKNYDEKLSEFKDLNGLEVKRF